MADDVLAPAGVDLWASVLRRQPWPLPLLATYPMDVTAGIRRDARNSTRAMVPSFVTRV